jgi:hypothetical protein
MGDSRPPNRLTSWLPTERLAKAWQAVVAGLPLDR